MLCIPKADNKYFCSIAYEKNDDLIALYARNTELTYFKTQLTFLRGCVHFYPLIAPFVFTELFNNVLLVGKEIR